jgi:tRNA pseudouridine38-40 synthase
VYKRQVLKALNGMLSLEIAVKKVQLVDLSFNARFSARGKIYRYQIWNSKIRNPFLLDRAWHIPFELDFEKMVEASKVFIGTHDFTAFSKNEEGRNPVINVESLTLEKKGKLIVIRIKATHFLRYMVRRIVGSLVEVGKGRITIEQLREILESRDPSKAPFNAKPYGLYLEKVFLNL